MSSWVDPIDRVITCVRIPIESLRPTRRNAIRLHEPPQRRIIKPRLVIHQPQAACTGLSSVQSREAVSLRIQRPLPGIAEIGCADLRLIIIRQIPHFAKWIVTLLLQERSSGIQHGCHRTQVIGQEIAQCRTRPIRAGGHCDRLGVATRSLGHERCQAAGQFLEVAACGCTPAPPSCSMQAAG